MIFTMESGSAKGRAWCARLMASTDPWLTLGRDYEDCLARCGHAEYTLLVASEDGVRLGFALLHPRGVAGSPYIASIAVSADARGHGVGSALLAEAESYFPGARHMFLCVSSFNGAARRLYERRGYQAVGELVDYVIDGASETLMHKRMAAS
jgi:[ribosomal protein S18]-alanine N-acetyltransferase